MVTVIILNLLKNVFKLVVSFKIINNFLKYLSLFSFHNLIRFYFIDMSCDSGQAVTCFHDPCNHKYCPNIPNTVCVSKSCGECSAHFYNTTGDDVTDLCSK